MAQCPARPRTTKGVRRLKGQVVLINLSSGCLSLKHPTSPADELSWINYLQRGVATNLRCSEDTWSAQIRNSPNG